MIANGFDLNTTVNEVPLMMAATESRTLFLSLLDEGVFKVADPNLPSLSQRKLQ
jgi:ankyrin repeat protein